MRVTKTTPPKLFTNYTKYRGHTRADFRSTCAYCFRHESMLGGAAHFDQDHFKPKCQPGVDPADHRNLYWSCKECNSPSCKWDCWPKPAQEAKGERFSDCAKYEPLNSDYQLGSDGKLVSVSPAGDFTIRHIGLNRRPLLVEQRRTQFEYCAAMQAFEPICGKLRDAATRLGGVAQRSIAIIDQLVEASRDDGTFGPLPIEPGWLATLIEGLKVELELG